jgi:hypothetical protein
MKTIYTGGNLLLLYDLFFRDTYTTRIPDTKNCNKCTVGKFHVFCNYRWKIYNNWSTWRTIRWYQDDGTLICAVRFILLFHNFHCYNQPITSLFLQLCDDPIFYLKQKGKHFYLTKFWILYFSIVHNPYDEQVYLCVAMTKNVLLMQWYEPLDKFMKVKVIHVIYLIL